MNFKKASLLFSTALSLSTGAITDSFSRPSISAEFAGSGGNCYLVGKFSFAEDYELTLAEQEAIESQPWYGLENVLSANSLSESLSGYGFINTWRYSSEGGPQPRLMLMGI